MTLIDRVIRRAERYVESIDCERDRLASELDEYISDVRRAFIRERLGVLERERREALTLVEDLRTKRYRPELMFNTRPTRMLKVPLRIRPERKRA